MSTTAGAPLSAGRDLKPDNTSVAHNGGINGWYRVVIAVDTTDFPVPVATNTAVLVET